MRSWCAQLTSKAEVSRCDFGGWILQAKNLKSCSLFVLPSTSSLPASRLSVRAIYIRTYVRSPNPPRTASVLPQTSSHPLSQPWLSSWAFRVVSATAVFSLSRVKPTALALAPMALSTRLSATSSPVPPRFCTPSSLQPGTLPPAASSNVSSKSATS